MACRWRLNPEGLRREGEPHTTTIRGQLQETRKYRIHCNLWENPGTCGENPVKSGGVLAKGVFVYIGRMVSLDVTCCINWHYEFTRSTDAVALWCVVFPWREAWEAALRMQSSDNLNQLTLAKHRHCVSFKTSTPL